MSDAAQSTKTPGEQSQNENWALLLDDNLLSATRIEAQLRALGLTPRTRRDVPRADSVAPQLILVNLGSRSLRGLEKIETCRERFPTARLAGFCGHLEIEIRRAAKANGLGRVLTNEDVMADLKTALNW